MPSQLQLLQRGVGVRWPTLPNAAYCCLQLVLLPMHTVTSYVVYSLAFGPPK
ncbi:uncharacterized protein BDZ99DRAFT_457556 [Mytilinidion resinicola]|uniref:Uncharacterized protein n=1 Tax=Mytilinidion resinicola TaxID=574789 RepID=A0A6A6XZR8_9PEZI|nr:uncharacterized protein BDZ99DRAFT_469785 [Mytilinidion resinicola]XP_033568366.1 uncharacterized protein BDZ99DRAFT_469728 [Mytilinidion resinicola]XP_033568605.1 uncharacterized protein BDZ99DRAFT_469399 [Mytilinidion resinicola]XP_033568863.1 uncharacterized protein BDZ99DRAFT_469206 [Mytilinidion resinicola]XP_033569540.1 uncharacterized protein BDZ99DRAFT_468793 [Mytilinidion resinicola]XP_033569852.1 uncharacterized protein BDZ99DRAFT_468568 [Mytilinidion resinicola]XP_033569963.1 un